MGCSRSFDVVTSVVGIFLSVLLLSSCEVGPSIPSQPANCPDGTASTGSTTAQIDGISWTAVCVPPAGNGVQFGYIDVSAQDANRHLTFRVHAGGPRDLLGTVPLTVGTYQIGGQPSIYGGDSYALIAICSSAASQVCPAWTAQPQLGSGTVTITTLTDRSITGTFSFTLVALSGTGATGSVAITNGNFSVTF